MPKGIGYPDDKKKKRAGAVLGAVGGSLQSAARGVLSPRATRLKERKRIEALMASGRPGRRPPVQPEKPIQGEGATRAVGFGSLLDALIPKPKKRGQR